MSVESPRALIVASEILAEVNGFVGTIPRDSQLLIMPHFIGLNLQYNSHADETYGHK